MLGNNKGFTVIELVIVLIVIFGGYGWVHNIISIIHSNIIPLTGEIILRIIGVFMVPLGAVMGYI